MPLTRPQQITLKRAQKDAAIDDADYRDMIATVAGIPDCRSSTDPRITDDHFDKLMKWFEAIFWQGSAGRAATGVHASQIFRTPGYWKNRNQPGNTSRDRYHETALQTERQQLEDELCRLGYGFTYIAAIQSHIQPFSLVNYLAALRRTIKSKQRKSAACSKT